MLLLHLLQPILPDNPRRGVCDVALSPTLAPALTNAPAFTPSSAPAPVSVSAQS